MNRCQELESYLAGMLHGEALAAFEKHLGQCAECRTEVDESHLADEHFRAWSDRRRPPQHTPQMTTALMERAAGSSAPVALWPRLALGGVGAVLVVAAISLVIYYRGGDEHAGEGAAMGADDLAIEVLHWAGGDGSAVARGGEGTVVLAPGDHRLVAGLHGDRLGLSAGGRAQILRADREATLIRLDRGVLAVMARKRGPGESLRVRAGEWAVEVVGTRFSVSMTESGTLAVSVSEGRVRLVAPNGEVTDVDAGQRAAPEPGAADLRAHELTDEQRDQIDELLEVPSSASARDGLEQEAEPSPGRAESAPPVEPLDTDSRGPMREQPGRQAADPAPETPDTDSALQSPTAYDTEPEIDLAEVRRRIVNGEYRAAEDVLIQHLGSAPGDLEAWSLLADARRKDGRFRPAVAAYRQIIELGGPAQSNRARFKAAVLLQDKLHDQAAAASLFRAYLSRAPALRPLTSEALYRLARAELALGHPADARKLLEQILAEHGGTVAAVKARRFLNELGPAEPE